MADDPIKETSEALASVFAKLGVLSGASPDMAAIGASVRQALTDVAKQIKP